jgi:hypothetical protein
MAGFSLLLLRFVDRESASVAFKAVHGVGAADSLWLLTDGPGKTLLGSRSMPDVILRRYASYIIDAILTEGWSMNHHPDAGLDAGIPGNSRTSSSGHEQSGFL